MATAVYGGGVQVENWVYHLLDHTLLVGRRTLETNRDKRYCMI